MAKGPHFKLHGLTIGRTRSTQIIGKLRQENILTGFIGSTNPIPLAPWPKQALNKIWAEYPHIQAEAVSGPDILDSAGLCRHTESLESSETCYRLPLHVIASR